MSARKKIVYILPEYRETIDTHLYHNYEFLEQAKNIFDIFLIVEKGDRPKSFGHTYRMLFQFAPLRAAELFFVLASLRLRGYKTFWTHYSFYGAIVAPIFGKSYYWNCGMPWLYDRTAFEEKIFRTALRRSILVTGTEGMKSEYIAHYALLAERVCVMPNWISLDRFDAWQGRREEARRQLSLADDTRVVFYLHHLSKRKGADLIAPIARFFEHDDKVLFVVAGAGPLEREIRGINIRLVGKVPSRDVPMYMVAADVFFMPSEEEGFPHVLLEAMALGVPFVASDVGGVKEIVPSETRDFVIKQDAGLFAEKIKKILDDTTLSSNLANAERVWVERYSIESALKIFTGLLEDKTR